MDIRRLLPLSGIVFVALLIIPVIFIGGDTPESDATASEVAAFYGDETVRHAGNVYRDGLARNVLPQTDGESVLAGDGSK